MGKYVKIQTNKPFRVFSGLQTVNTTTNSEAIKDRLNVEALWPELFVILKEGVWYYPSVVKTWPSVQNLSQSEHITIGAELDDIQDDEKLAYAKEMYNRLEKGYKRLEQKGFENPMKEKVSSKPKKTTTQNKNLIDETNENTEE